MDDVEIPVTLKLSQWQVAVEALSKAPAPWVLMNPVIAAIISAGQAATAPAPTPEIKEPTA